MRTERVSLHQNDARPVLMRRVRLATSEKLQDHMYLSPLARSQDVMVEMKRMLE